MREHVFSPRYESVLSTHRFDAFGGVILDLRVRTYFEPYDPDRPNAYVANSGEKTKCVSWDDTEFSEWCRRFKSVVEGAWNHKLWLEPSGWWGLHGQRPTFTHGGWYPYVACNLTIVPVSAAGHSNCHVLVRKLDPREDFFRSSARFRATREAVDMNLDDHDLTPRSSGQIPVVHEIGHYLGLAHVNAEGSDDCRVNSNLDECYGPPGSYQASDLMGRGTRLDHWHAWPWLRQIHHHVDSRYQSVVWTGTRIRPHRHVLGPAHPVEIPFDGGVPLPGGVPSQGGGG